jgi:hypothetical protein
MIALVYTYKGPAGPLSDEVRKWTEDAVAEARAVDGVEADIVIGDPATGEGITVVLLRDQAALDAHEVQARGPIAEAEALGVEGTSTRVYSQVIAAL